MEEKYLHHPEGFEKLKGKKIFRKIHFQVPLRNISETK